MANTVYRDYNFVIPAGGSCQQQNVQGDYWQIIVAPHNVTLLFDNGNTITDGAGAGAPMAYKSVILSGTAGDTVVLRLGFCNGVPPLSTRVTLAALNVTTSVPVASVQTPQGDVPVAAATNNVAVIGANLNRRAVIIKSRSSNSTSVRIGPDAAHGVELDPGDVVTLETTAAIAASNASAAAVTLTVTELVT